MKNNSKLLSLCIPTNGAKHYVLPVLDSIYSQGVDDALFEVVVTDNGRGSDLGEAIDGYKTHGNLVYYKSELTGFVNQIDAFKHSNGLFIKMINHRAKLLPGVLEKMIDLVKEYKDTQPFIYCSDGVLKIKDITECKDFDTFVRMLSYYSSWSAGVGIWFKDKSMLNQISYNQMFPHASLIFEIRQSSEYVIWNKKYQEMQDEAGKGGYNIYKTFAVDYLDILNELRQKGKISIETFIHIKSDLYFFIQRWYDILNSNKNKYTFDTSNMEMYLKVYYSKSEIRCIKINFLRQIKRFLGARLKKCIKFLCV